MDFWLIVERAFQIFFFIFVIVEMAQLWKLVQISKQQTTLWEKMLENPEYAGQVIANAIEGLLVKLANNPEFESKVLNFVNMLAVSGFASVKEFVKGNGEALIKPILKLPKRHWAKPFEEIANSLAPEYIEELKATKKAAKQITKAIDSDAILAFQNEG